MEVIPRNEWIQERLKCLYTACLHSMESGEEVRKEWVEEIQEHQKTLYGVWLNVIAQSPYPWTYPYPWNPITISSCETIPFISGFQVLQ